MARKSTAGFRFTIGHLSCLLVVYGAYKEVRSEMRAWSDARNAEATLIAEHKQLVAAKEKQEKLATDMLKLTGEIAKLDEKINGEVGRAFTEDAHMKDDISDLKKRVIPSGAQPIINK